MILFIIQPTYARNKFDMLTVFRKMRNSKHKITKTKTVSGDITCKLLKIAIRPKEYHL